MPKIIKENKFFILDKPYKKSFKSGLKAIKNYFLSVFFGLIIKLNHKKSKENKKYNISICAIFKNEARYLKEWIEFHKIIGVDHFYMYNNNSEDNFREILKPYIEEGSITLVEWTKNQAQMEAYENCIETFSNESSWLGFIDLDEFIVPKCFNNLGEFLDKFKNRPAVLIYWKMFCSSGKIERKNGLVTEDFILSWEKNSNIGKCFYNTNYSFSLKNKRNKCLHHLLWTKIVNFNVPPVNIFNKVSFSGRNKANCKNFPIQINHYFTKSWNEYLEKKSKGDVYFRINPHDEQYFFEHDEKSFYPDYSAYKYLVKLKNNMNIRSGKNE